METGLALINVSVATAHFRRKVQLEHVYLMPGLFATLKYNIKIKVSSLNTRKGPCQAHYIP